jgi:hypothetical protein
MLKRIFALIDIRDATFLVGLALLAYGLWLVFIPAAFIGVGALLVAMVLIPRITKFKEGEKTK